MADGSACSGWGGRLRCISYTSLLRLQNRSATECGDLMLLRKALNWVLGRFAEETLPGTGR